MDDEGLPATRMNIMLLMPDLEDNYILCLRVKNAETSDRKTPYDEVYTGYHDGRIVYNQILDTSEVKSEILWKGKFSPKI